MKRLSTEIFVRKADGTTYEAKMDLPSYFYDERGIYYGLEIKAGPRHILFGNLPNETFLRIDSGKQIKEEHYVFHHSDEVTDLVRISKEDFESAMDDFLKSQMIKSVE